MKASKILKFVGIILLGIAFYFLFTTNIEKTDVEKKSKTSSGNIETNFQLNKIIKTSSGKTETSTGIIYKRAGIKENLEGIYIELPSKNIFKFAGTYKKDLNYWLEVLEKEDKNADKYIILPTQGLVMPLNYLTKESNDYKTFINGKNIDFNKYLEDGAFEIPGTSKNGYGEYGNKVISGHSSYYKVSPGRYKTHFQKIIEMNPGDQIWIYEKNTEGKYYRYAYITEKSYNTENNDISILKPGSGKNITLFTCTPIGGISGRWVVKGKFLGKYEK